MRTGLITKKLGMSSSFTLDGKRLTLTFLHVNSCQVVGHKTFSKDGYNAVIVGAIPKKASKVPKPMQRVFANAGVEPKAKLKEFRVLNDDMLLEIGTQLGPDHYKIGQFVDVSGTSIGKGFAGSMKRHGFHGLEASHGVSISHRSHGSTGQCQDPGKVFKGKKMAGHLGSVSVTVQNLKVVDLDAENGLIIINGSIPGSIGSYVYIKDAVKKLSYAIQRRNLPEN